MFNSPITANISLTNIPCTSPVRHAKGKNVKITPKSFFTYQIFSSVQVFQKVFFKTACLHWKGVLCHKFGGMTFPFGAPYRYRRRYIDFRTVQQVHFQHFRYQLSYNEKYTARRCEVFLVSLVFPACSSDFIIPVPV